MSDLRDDAESYFEEEKEMSDEHSTYKRESLLDLIGELWAMYPSLEFAEIIKRIFAASGKVAMSELSVDEWIETTDRIITEGWPK